MKAQNGQAASALHCVLRDGIAVCRNPEGTISVLEHPEDIISAAQGIHQLNCSQLISTAFTRSPLCYSPDFGTMIPSDVVFIRITLARFLDEDGRAVLQKRMSKFACRATLRVVPRGRMLTGPSGLFVRMPDGTHLSFVALEDPWRRENSHRVLFCGELAAHFFQYYERLNWMSE